MQSYLDMVDYVLKNGKRKQNRTGVPTISVSGYMFKHNMNEGFPLLTTKKMGYKTIFAELEFFIKGMTDKQWLIDNKCHIWDEWCSPLKVPYGHDEETKKKMMEEKDLGPIYGYQWRKFNERMLDEDKNVIVGGDFSGVDQLKGLIDEAKANPDSRRLIVNSWNPNQLHAMALPPCHVLWQVLINKEEKTIDLMFYQRSCDLMLGIPYNIASYACLLHLLAIELGYKANQLIGFLGDLHIYENHIEGAKEQLKRTPHKLPQIETMISGDKFDILNWQYQQTKVVNYEHEDPIKFEVAV